MKKLFLVWSMVVCSLHGMSIDKKQKNELIVYTIPGMCGGGSSKEYVESVVGFQSKVVEVEIPKKRIDFGQQQCGTYLDKVLNNKENKEGILHATSQGVATALNYLGKKNGDAKIKALILEGSLVSANSAIYYQGTQMIKFLQKLPLSYYWMPYIAPSVSRARFNVDIRGYRPAGPQAIKSIDTLPTHLPIIIIHSKKDDTISYSDACALYYGLRLCGNKNVYFIEKEGIEHMDILKSDTEKNIVRCILHEHGLLQQKLINIDLSEYQPDHTQFKKHYDDLIKKEKRHIYLERSLYASAIVTLAMLTKYFMS